MNDEPERLSYFWSCLIIGMVLLSLFIITGSALWLITH